MMKRVVMVFAVLVCFFSISNVCAADTYVISGMVTEMTTVPNMIAIDEGDVVTEVYGIRFSYLERQYNIVVEIGTEVTVEATENVCYDGTIRLKATSITVGDATIDLAATTSGSTRSGSGRGRNR